MTIGLPPLPAQQPVQVDWLLCRQSAAFSMLLDVKRLRQLYEQVQATRNNCRFEDIERMLAAAGARARQPRSGGSHYTFTLGVQTLTVPRRHPVKRMYVDRALELVEELLGS